jgi:hypothetical protein
MATERTHGLTLSEEETEVLLDATRTWAWMLALAGKRARSDTCERVAKRLDELRRIVRKDG